MNEEMRVEAMELCVTACEKHANSNEVSYSVVFSELIVSCYWRYINVFGKKLTFEVAKLHTKINTHS